jgi:hypothetical protein
MAACSIIGIYSIIIDLPLFQNTTIILTQQQHVGFGHVRFSKQVTTSGHFHATKQALRNSLLTWTSEG